MLLTANIFELVNVREVIIIIKNKLLLILFHKYICFIFLTCILLMKQKKTVSIII